MKSSPTRVLLWLVLVVAAVGVVAYRHRHPAEHLAAGIPLDQSHSQIKVLSPTEEPTPLPTNTSSSAIIGAPTSASAADAPIILTSATVITTPIAATPAAASAQATANLQLGVMLALASQQYATGGSAALATLKQAQQLASGDIKQKITGLLSHTPENGPITPALLLVEAQRVRALGAPEGEDDAEPATPDASSWFSKFVLVRNIQPRPTLTWSHALNAALLQLAANNPGGCAAQLNEAPLKTDARLDDLRTALADYVDQTNAMDAVLTAYANLVGAQQ